MDTSIQRRSVDRSVFLAILIGAFLIAGCDGGLFGTGGGDAGSASSGVIFEGTGADATGPEAPGSSDGSAGGTSGGASGGLSGSDMSSGGSSDGDDGVSTIADDARPLINGTVGQAGGDALLRVVNLSDSAVSVLVDDVASDLLMVGPGATGGVYVIPGDAGRIEVSDIDGQRSFALFEPVDTVAGSLTYLILRDTSDTSGSPDVRALPTLTRPSIVGTALVRVFVVDSLAGDAEVATDNLRLEPLSAEANGGPLFEPVSFSMPATDYVIITAGDYRLLENRVGLDATDLSFAADIAYTIYLRPGGDPQVELVPDTAE